MFQFLSSEAGPALMEFGLGSPSTDSSIDERDVIFLIDTRNGTISPDTIVNMGYYYAGSGLDFYNISDWSTPIKWAFSSHLSASPTNEDLAVFTDRDNSLGWGGSIVESIGQDSWVLHMDDAWSYNIDDDDNEMVIKVWVDTSASPPAPVPEPTTILLVGIGLTTTLATRKIIRMKRRCYT